ncbi:MAG: hypothetical protein JWN89_377 [Parcubacteria group bacterium]|nr:hypothetical protein [Parcubacteria group bacterium]
MATRSSKTKSKGPKKFFVLGGALAILGGSIYTLNYSDLLAVEYGTPGAVSSTTPVRALIDAVKPVPKLDKDAYDKKLIEISNVASTSATSTRLLWGPKPHVYPNAGAILPFKRIVAYYGNFYSKGMGVLGEYPEDIMLEKLRAEMARWNEADPKTPVLPAIDYIVTTAQGSAGKDGKYRLRMPDSQIDRALELAHKVDGIVILDVQVGLSDLEHELPVLEKYLSMPEVHLAIDPEFSMKTGAKPGTVIGTMDEKDINYAAEYLATLVRAHNLPPKVLVIHRFTEDMVTNYKVVRPLPEVEIVVDMDGWGFAAKKINTYQQVVYPEPIQFTGFKLFYKNDLKPPSTRLLTPAEVLKLVPAPLFIQYQ